MNRIVEYVKSITPDGLIKIIIVTLFLGVLLSLVVATSTIISLGLYTSSLCFTNQCVNTFIDNIDASILILEFTFSFLILIVTAGGVGIALSHYLVDSASKALENHLSNFSVFSEYLHKEISKTDSISFQSINIFSFYNLIFSRSKEGDMSVSGKYRGLIASLNQELRTANELARNPVGGGFHVNKHQDRMNPIFKSLHFDVGRYNKADYFAVETAVLHIVDIVNQSFCYDSDLEELEKRCYF